MFEFLVPPSTFVASIFVMETNTSTVIEQSVVLDEYTAQSHRLIVHNDNHNTFEWVIKTLVQVCKHTEEQAEQCAYFVHYKGKYAVKHGSHEGLKPFKDSITERGINATIE